MPKRLSAAARCRRRFDHLEAAAAADAVPGEWQGGWWRAARRCPSPNVGPRPTGTAVTLALIHSISLPPGVYQGDAVEALFTNRLDWDADPYFQRIRGLRVSAHFFVRRDGGCVQFADVRDRAWHAGESAWRGRPGCNDFSVGIELEGLEGEPFEAPQYATLGGLLQALRRCCPLRGVAGHQHVAPGRKGDPGNAFDWPRLDRALAWPIGFYPRRVASQLRARRRSVHYR